MSKRRCRAALTVLRSLRVFIRWTGMWRSSTKDTVRIPALVGSLSLPGSSWRGTEIRSTPCRSHSSAWKAAERLLHPTLLVNTITMWFMTNESTRVLCSAVTRSTQPKFIWRIICLNRILTAWQLCSWLTGLILSECFQVSSSTLVNRTKAYI